MKVEVALVLLNGPGDDGGAADRGYEQSFVERARDGSTWGGVLRRADDAVVPAAGMAFGVMMTVGLVLLLWGFLTIGRGETRAAKAVPSPEDAA